MDYLSEVRRPAGLARMGRATAQAVERALGHGLVIAAEVEATAFVTKTALMHGAKDLAQAGVVLNAAAGSRLHAYVVVSLLTGIRTVEARALGWERTHLAKGGELPPHIEVWRSVRAGGGTKTRKSRRTLALLPQAVDALKMHRARQAAERLAAGPLWNPRAGSCSRPRYVPRSMRPTSGGHSARDRKSRPGGRLDTPESYGTASCHCARLTA